MMMLRFYASFTLFALFILVACHQQRDSSKKAKTRDLAHYTQQDYIELSMDSSDVNNFLTRYKTYSAYSEAIRNFYRKRDFHYAWINKGGLTEQAGNFINLVKSDAAYGINDSSLIAAELQPLIDTMLVSEVRFKPGDTVAPLVELLFTAQFFAYGNKVWNGFTADSAKDLEWFIPRKKINIERLLDSIVKAKSYALEEIEPVNRQYKLLRQQLQTLIRLKSQHWDTIRTIQKSFKKGDSAVVITLVKKRLAAFGDLTEIDSSVWFTATLDTALRNFQVRMGLKEDGLIQQHVLDALNTPIQQRIQKVLLNMERLRWVPVEPTTDYIFVNIPEFKMHVYDKGIHSWSCNVVVGKPGSNTVIFSNELRYVVFSPHWNVPPGILSKEVLPGLKRSGRGYLSSQNMEIVNANGKVIAPASIQLSKYSGKNFPYIVRQKPGGKNALGKVKFLFPNEYNIYLHDTPARYLFGENKRSFSHGCIRVAAPKHLAEWLLRDDSSWSEKKIDEAMNSNKEKFVTLKKPVPVFIGYFTSWVDNKGKLNFRDDVYGHDVRLAATLFGTDK